ncbi:baculoviral IAP repeat-containing protein 7-A-like [Pomacea canaliculata]|uniref:baculoviral IAP repeat-containing protein 7-A-like n=1 Tax=Pomacea canaliculata TaxID=400727 RepID=UPI000D731372|nr:baculoviral IAP repeat-containing protein 7-A-like [Pomacea canaliculata]
MSQRNSSRTSENQRVKAILAPHSPDVATVLEKGRVDTQDSEVYLAQFPVERESCLEEPSELLTEVQPLPVTIKSTTDLLQPEIERKKFHNVTASRYKVLLAENERLKRRQVCRLCKVHAVNATLLPCGHFVYCLDCAQTLERCGVCDKEILGDVRTFLS